MSDRPGPTNSGESETQRRSWFPKAVQSWGKRNSAAVSIASSLSFENISLEISGKKILQDISLNVEPGEVLCLLGPSGSGKTSLLRIAAGLARSDTGVLRIDGRTVADNSTFVMPDKRGIGLVFQDYALFPHLTILQNVEFGLKDLGHYDAREQAMRVLDRVGMADRADHYPDVLSGGEQQRVALARALAPRPGVLLMDEPFSGLDSRLRDSVRAQTLELLRETRSTCIIVTHDAEEALRVGDHIALLRNGKLVQYGSGHDLYYRPNCLFAAGFFSEINVIPVETRGKTALTPFGTREIPDGMSNQICSAVRHTDIEVHDYKSNCDGLVGRIINRRFIGRSELLEIAVEGMENPVVVRSKAGEILSDAALVCLHAEADRLMLFEIDG